MREAGFLPEFEGGERRDGGAGTNGGGEWIGARGQRAGRRPLRREGGASGRGGSGQAETRLRAAALREPMRKTSAERVLPAGETEQ